jgi:hypothetical protein
MSCYRAKRIIFSERSKDLCLIEDGAGTYHPIERRFLAPVIPTLRDWRRPIVRKRDLDRVVLLVNGPLNAIRGTHAYHYLKYGEVTTYPSKKSKAVPVPERTSVAAREPWYDLTLMIRPGFAVWPLAHHYRHVIPANPEALIANKRMIDLRSPGLSNVEQGAMIAILNSTLVGLIKTFFGRYTGTEGSLGTDVLDVEMMEVPDPRGIDAQLAMRLTTAFSAMSKRESGRLVEDALVECHSYERALELAKRPLVVPGELAQADRRALDEAVYELLGETTAGLRLDWIERLYFETASYLRDVRVTEIQKLEDRRAGEVTRFVAVDHAADVWDAIDLAEVRPLSDWLRDHAGATAELLSIPTARPVTLTADAIFDADTVYFGRDRSQHCVCDNHSQAELVARIARLGVGGDVAVPSDADEAAELLKLLNARHEKAMGRFRELAESRSGDSETVSEVLTVLQRWYVSGRDAPARRRGQRDKSEGDS